MAVDLIYETHSTSEDNEAGIATGWLPGKLSEVGRGQARELGERHRDDGIAVVFTSDLSRAMETAEIAFADRDVKVLHDERLRECNYGELNGATVEVVHAERSKRVDTPFPRGQSYRDVVHQTEAFLADVRRDYDGKLVLIIAHSANRLALQCLLEGTNLEDLVTAPFDWRPGWRYVLP